MKKPKPNNPTGEAPVRCSAVVSCPRCKSRGKDWNGSHPKCAFETGVFNPDNWNCATANALRDIVKADNWNNNDDQHACLITGAEDSLHVLLHWYKNRGRTEGAWMVTIEGEMKPLTLTEAERVVAANVPALPTEGAAQDS